jgi:uncharacterized membrane protein YdbT with pleckstrin-like domain
MDEKQLWYGRPSFWNIHASIINLIKTCIICAVLFYCSRYIPDNGIPVPKIPMPEILSKMEGDQFYLVIFLSLLIIRRLWKLIKHFLNILCTEIELTEFRINFRHGIFNKFKKGIELYRVKDLSLYEPFLYRILGLQNVHIVAADHTIRFPKLIGIPKNAELYDLLNQHVEIARDQKGVKEVDYFNR